MKLLYMGIGILFLANPLFGVTDHLPDFIGCFLIMSAVKDAAYMIEKLESARKWFKYAAWLSIVRVLVSMLDIERHHTLPLTLAFSFAVVELIVYIPAFKELFAGFDYAAMRHGGSGVLSMGRKMGFYTDESGARQYGEIQDDTTGRLAVLSQVFIVIRALASLLPELPALQLSDSENVGDVTGFQFASITNLILLVSVVIALVPAVIMVVQYLRFLLRIRKSGDFVPAVNAELERRFGDLGELHICSRMKTMSLVMGAALLLYMGFYDYQINVIPRYVPAVIMCAASVMVFASSNRKFVNLLPIVPAAAVIPLSIRTYALQKDHYYGYKLQMMDLYDENVEYVYDKNINAMDGEYLRMAVWESLEAIVMGAGILLFLVLYIRLCLRHTADFRSVPGKDREDNAKSLKIRGGIMLAAVSLSVLYYTAYRFILPYFDMAAILGVGVHIIAVIAYVYYTVGANDCVYGNLHGV